MDENEENTIQAVAADIAQVVEKVAETAKVEPVKFVEVSRLKEPQYKDPTPEQYVVHRENLTNTPAARETAEGIAAIHQAIHSTGHMPLW